MKNRNRPMNAAGWWANATTPARNATWTRSTHIGMVELSVFCALGNLRSSPLKMNVVAMALTKTATAAFQPMWVNMNQLSQFHFAATINTGGAAKDVSVPPMDTLTNSTPKVAYLSFVDT